MSRKMPRANRNHTLLMLLLVLLLVGQCLFIDSGIPGFTKRTKVMFKPAWRKLPLRSPPVPFDHVCIDMNQLLHCGARLAKEHEYASLFCKLDHLLRVVQPRKSLVLAFDGPAPLAKLQLQRSRRLADPENTQATPGTPFMDSMDDAMAHFVGQRWRRPAFRNINVFISGATVPGEGEIKIVRWINTHVKSPDDTVVLCGSDADMLVQAMALHPIKLSVLQSERSDHQVCSTSHVVMTLVNETRKAIGSAVSSCATPAEVADHVLLFLLLGNDYIPRLCQASDYSVIAAYRVAMASRRPSGEGLLDRSSKSFSFPALYAFMTALHSAHLQSFGLQPSFESSHQTYTSNARYLQEMSVLHELLAHRHCNMIWNPTHVDCLHLLVLDNNTQCMPGDRMFNGSKVLAEFFKTNVKLKRRGRNEVAAAALAVLFPQAHALRLQLTASVPGGARIAIMPPYDVTHRVYDWTAREKADGAPVPGYQQDVVAYLRGLLWISHIITSGVCSDVGYSYHGHYQITPSFVIAYLHEQLDRYRGTNKTYVSMSYVDMLELKEVQDFLRNDTHLPVSNSRPLSANATCACMYPSNVDPRHVPEHVHEVWRWVNQHYFAQHYRAHHNYTQLVKCLQDGTAVVGAHVLGDVLSNDSSPWTVLAASAMNATKNGNPHHSTVFRR